MTELAEGGKDYLYDLSSAISGSEPNQTVAQNFDLIHETHELGIQPDF
jgi:hypothetical protein